MEMETFRTKSYTVSFASDQSNHNEGFGTAPLCYQFHAATNLQQPLTTGWERHFPVVDRLSPTGL